MLTIRLTRKGTKKKPFFRIVVIENSKKINGEPVEILGYWNPIKDSLKINSESVASWVNKGAIPTPKVKQLIAKSYGKSS